MFGKRFLPRMVATVGVLVLAPLCLAGIASAATMGAEPPKPHGACGTSQNPSTSRGHAHWDLTCANGEITVTGWVHHDNGSGCSAVKANFEGQATETSRASCGLFGGDTYNFQWTHPGSLVDVYLYDYNN